MAVPAGPTEIASRSDPRRRIGRRIVWAITVAAVVMYAASRIWRDTGAWFLLPLMLAPAPFVLWLSNRYVPAGVPYTVVLFGFGLGLFAQALLTWYSVEQYLLIVWGIGITGIPIERYYELLVLVAPVAVGAPILVAFCVALTLKLISRVADRHSPR